MANVIFYGYLFFEKIILGALLGQPAMQRARRLAVIRHSCRTCYLERCSNYKDL